MQNPESENQAKNALKESDETKSVNVCGPVRIPQWRKLLSAGYLLGMECWIGYDAVISLSLGLRVLSLRFVTILNSTQ